ncbi:hypothetical protein [uncultured Shimia sp.]|uniref:hypothetical protein n=1 Tax=uncultured Shimia sp. TaxID=573152 RepID=UPI002618D287|nr:hypothetical protein [uncultured Shimia sp.]
MHYVDEGSGDPILFIRGSWFVEVTGVLPDGAAYQNIMNVNAGGTADIVGGWMFGAAGVKFTDSPASITRVDGNRFEIQMFAFLADVESGAPKGMNVTVYRGEMEQNAETFAAEADLYYLPCSIEYCPAPNVVDLGAPATVAQVTGTRLAGPVNVSH